MPHPFKIPYNVFEKEWKEYCKKQIEKRIDIKEDTGCWNWKGTTVGEGSIRIKLKGIITLSALRISYMTYIGEVPEKFSIGRKCKNLICVNPDHFFLLQHGMTYWAYDSLYSKVLDEDLNIINVCH